MHEASGTEAVPEAERYRALLEINNAVVGNLTRETLFAAIAPALRRILPFERIAIFLHDPELDRALRVILHWMIAGVGAPWMVQDLDATGRLYRIPAVSP